MSSFKCRRKPAAAASRTAKGQGPNANLPRPQAEAEVEEFGGRKNESDDLSGQIYARLQGRIMRPSEEKKNMRATYK
jgi:hypothetical protein